MCPPQIQGYVLTFLAGKVDFESYFQFQMDQKVIRYTDKPLSLILQHFLTAQSKAQFTWLKQTVMAIINIYFHTNYNKTGPKK